MLADSHKYIYEFVPDYDTEDIELYNINFHHDTYPTSGTTTPDSGNWFRYLLEDGNVSNGYWVACEQSYRDDCLPKEISLAELPKEGYDLIFVCRSGWWSPPHLDKYFLEYRAEPLRNSGWYGKVETDILKAEPSCLAFCIMVYLL